METTVKVVTEYEDGRYTMVKAWEGAPIYTKISWLEWKLYKLFLEWDYWWHRRLCKYSNDEYYRSEWTSSFDYWGDNPEVTPVWHLNKKGD